MEFMEATLVSQCKSYMSHWPAVMDLFQFPPVNVGDVCLVFRDVDGNSERSQWKAVSDSATELRTLEKRCALQT